MAQHAAHRGRKALGDAAFARAFFVFAYGKNVHPFFPQTLIPLYNRG